MPVPVRISIVEDDLSRLYLLQTMLDGNDYDAVTADDGAEALENARAAPPNLATTEAPMHVIGYPLR